MPFDVKATAVQLESDWTCNNDNAWFAIIGIIQNESVMHYDCGSIRCFNIPLIGLLLLLSTSSYAASCS